MVDDLPDMKDGDLPAETDDGDFWSKFGLGAAAGAAGIVAVVYLVPLLFWSLGLLVKLAIFAAVAYGAYRVGSAMLGDDGASDQRTLPQDERRELLEDRSVEEIADMELEREFEDLERDVDEEA